MPVSRVLLILAACALLSGCLPVPLYYREGAAVAQIDAAETRCRVAALREVPEARRTRYIPPTYSYPTTCNAAGVCRTTPILISPGRWETYDANEGLRAETAKLCMAEKGYARIRLKPCAPAVIEATRLTATQVQPALTARSCIIRLNTGRYKIVTP
ncbi:hypothetical protein [Roseovarius aestuariivivens]|uniref:hypothetical protein n=1 Tax=Roseovarius aestuariivivens TaxID=1888910 RepID=UPI00108015E4|nr:hypothetical protein [Roseovarius aestuariivivens]